MEACWGLLIGSEKSLGDVMLLCGITWGRDKAGR